MRRVSLLLSAVVVATAAAAPLTAAGDSDLKILTYPIGLVIGEQPIDVDLGTGGEPAELFLDGQSVCLLRADRPRCTVDMGAAPHVHLLELIRRDETGRVMAHASQWVNRPGQEAELAIQLGPRSEAGICGGKALWSHPLKRDPVLLEVTENGRILLIGADKRSFRFPCPDPDVPHVLAASAIFPDGRRAEAVTLSGGFGGHTEAGLTAVPLVAEGSEAAPCDALTEGLGSLVKSAGDPGFEVVFVLDPTAGYRTLMATGWSKGMMPTTTSTTKQFDSLVQQGSKGSEAKPRNSWKRADASLIDANKMWFVMPDAELHRANGFARGKMNWLPLLFHFGSTKLEETPRLADAVAASGLVAAAGPRRRAVAVILGNKADRDGSEFSAQEARNYLAEVGVPLFVLRSGKLRDDGWPKGIPVRNMEAMADALEGIRQNLDGQCVVWFPGRMHPDKIAASLPEGVVVAGRRGEALGDVEAIWRQAAVAEVAAGEATAADVVAGGVPVGRGQVEVTAVNVLFAAEDAAGRPITDLTAVELSVAEDGSPVRVLGLTPAPRGLLETTEARPAGEEPAAARPALTGEGTPVAVYVDSRLSGSAEIVGALEALAERAEWLASLGPVDVVVADQEITTVLQAENDPAAIRTSLAGLAKQPAGRHAIELIRTRFLRDIRKYPDRLTPDDPQADDPNSGLMARLQRGEEPQELERSKVLTAARGAVFEEDAVLRQAMGRVSDWALAAPMARPRLLLVVGAGFDEDPVDFYLPFVERLETQHSGTAREDFKRYRQSERVEQVGLDLAASGWLVVPVATRTAGAQAVSADQGGGDRFQAFLSAQPDAIRTSSAEWLLLDPLGSQRHLAAPSGGEVAVGAKGLDRLIDTSAGWYRLSYQIDRPPDGLNHQLTVSSTRPGTQVRTTSVIASETLEGEAAARVRRLLRGPAETGDLGVEVAVGERTSVKDKRVAADVVVSMSFDAIAPLLEEGERSIRVSVGVLAGDNEPFILHRTESVGATAWRYTIPLQWPAGPAELAVVVEDLGSGAWGGATANLQ